MHNLEQINGETAFVAYRQPGWHGLGQVVEEEQFRAVVTPQLTQEPELPMIGGLHDYLFRRPAICSGL